MSKNRKFRVYLAGPISGCSEDQVYAWRKAVKEQYNEYLEFSDPTDVIQSESGFHW